MLQAFIVVTPKVQDPTLMATKEGQQITGNSLDLFTQYHGVDPRDVGMSNLWYKTWGRAPSEKSLSAIERLLRALAYNWNGAFAAVNERASI